MYLVWANVLCFILPSCELDEFAKEDVNCSEAELVVAVHIRLVFRVLEQQPDILDVHILGGHVDWCAVQLGVHVMGAGPASEQSLSLIKFLLRLQSRGHNYRVLYGMLYLTLNVKVMQLYI